MGSTSSKVILTGTSRASSEVETLSGTDVTGGHFLTFDSQVLFLARKIWIFPKIVVPHVNKVFHCEPSIFGVPLFLEISG